MIQMWHRTPRVILSAMLPVSRLRSTPPLWSAKISRRSGRARGDRIFVVQSVQDRMSENGSWSVEPMPMQL
jgi:hypothetical protein